MGDLMKVFRPEAIIDIDVKYLPLIRSLANIPMIPMIKMEDLPPDIQETIESIDNLKEEKAKIEVRKIQF